MVIGLDYDAQLGFSYGHLDKPSIEPLLEYMCGNPLVTPRAVTRLVETPAGFTLSYENLLVGVWPGWSGSNNTFAVTYSYATGTLAFDCDASMTSTQGTVAISPGDAVSTYIVPFPSNDWTPFAVGGSQSLLPPIPLAGIRGYGFLPLGGRLLFTPMVFDPAEGLASSYRLNCGRRTVLSRRCNPVPATVTPIDASPVLPLNAGPGRPRIRAHLGPVSSLTEGRAEEGCSAPLLARLRPGRVVRDRVFAPPLVRGMDADRAGWSGRW